MLSFTHRKIFALVMLTGALISGCGDRQTETALPTDLDVAITTIDDETVEINQQQPIAVDLPVSCFNQGIINAYNNQQSDVQVKGCGSVAVVLADDNKGSRHQKFIVRLDDVNPNHTVLIAHNIDLADRVGDLQQGDKVLFYGEYEYNPKGGVVHWTHHDPAARHQHGWIEKEGILYQ